MELTESQEIRDAGAQLDRGRLPEDGLWGALDAAGINGVEDAA